MAIISVKNTMATHSKSIYLLIRSRIFGNGRGWVFTPKHFQDLGSDSAVDSALRRLKAAGTIRHLARGLYDYPKVDPQLGALLPSTDDIAKALAGRDEIRLQSSGAHAANQLGLSTQVPMKVVYLTDGPSKMVKLGKQQIQLRRTTPKNMATAGKISGMAIQALKHLGKDQVDDDVIATLNKRLDDAARKQLMNDIRNAPAWIADIFRIIATPQKEAK